MFVLWHRVELGEIEGNGSSWRDQHRLPQLNTVWCRKGSTSSALRSAAGSDLWPGRIWRIGLMGETCRMENVDRLANAIATILP
jgi:alanine-glyoxylate transaminase/serine-glyoxylate transaminase/serine-pyruvate transaminase